MEYFRFSEQRFQRLTKENRTQTTKGNKFLIKHAELDEPRYPVTSSGTSKSPGKHTFSPGLIRSYFLWISLMLQNFGVFHGPSI